MCIVGLWGTLKNLAAREMYSGSRFSIRYTRCSLSEGYIGDFASMCSLRASGRGKIALKIAWKSSLTGLPKTIAPSQ